MLKRILNIIILHDFEPIELFNSLYLLFCCVPAYFGGDSLYSNILHQDKIVYFTTGIAIYQIIVIGANNLHLRFIGNVVALSVSFYALMNNTDDTLFNSCLNKYVLCSPVLFFLLAVRNKMELNET
jgi:hypothetical protein